MFGAWKGNTFSDNPKYLYLYVLKFHPHIIPVWVTNNDSVYVQIKTAGGKVVKKDSFQALPYVFSAEAFFYTFNDSEITDYGNASALKVELWHGMPLKKIGYNCEPPQPEKGSHDILIATAEIFRSSLCSAFGVPSDSIYITGQPRNDCFYERGSRKNVLSWMNLDKHNVVITYLPTFRNNFHSRGQAGAIITELTRNMRFKTILEQHNAVCLIKEHYNRLMYSKDHIQIDRQDRISIISAISDIEDIQELLCASDILITDYSSCYIDYLLLNRPIIFFCYDLETYKNTDRGFYYDFDEVTPGPKVRTVDQLAEELENYLQNPLRDTERRTQICNLFHQYQDNKSSERVYQLVSNILLERKNKLEGILEFRGNSAHLIHDILK